MLKVNELFSGIGSQKAALERLGIEHEIIGIAEIDKYAIKSYEAIHGPVRNYGDISKIDKLDYADFWTYSFPCQDISVAGKQAGINEHTRSGLLYQVERLLQVSKEHDELPKYLMLENVKNLVGKKFKAQFDEWIQRLDELGYNTYWQVLNAKNYGIPQNRERVFAISILKDIDIGYVFPEPFELKKRLKDILEKEVDEKYYINSEKAKKLISQITQTGTGLLSEQATKLDGMTECANTLLARDYKGFDNQAMNCVIENFDQKRIGGLYDGETKHQAGSVWDINCIAPTVDTMQGGNRQPCILEPCIAANRGRNPDNPSDRTVGSPTDQRLEINQNGTSNTITTVQKDNYLMEPQYRIRKLTPLECWRLMGFKDEQFYKAEKVNSNSQLYKQAGNSIVVDVLYYIFKNLFIDKPTVKKIDNLDQLPGQMSIFDL